jgi:hypothetical protein
MRHLTDDILLSVKDAVRNLRYAIRSEARSSRVASPAQVRPGEARERFTPREARRRHRVARFVDSVFTEVETGALSLVSPKRERRHGVMFPQPVTAYFARVQRHGDEAAERLFTRAHYHAVKARLRGFGLHNALIFEHAIGRARDTVLLRHADLVARVCAPSVSPIADEARAMRVRLCAAVTCALVAARPIKEIDLEVRDPSLPGSLVAFPNAYCFTATGLSTAIASLQDEAGSPASAAEIVESANAIVDIRFARFAAALEADDPVEALATEFNEVLPFLP